MLEALFGGVMDDVLVLAGVGLENKIWGAKCGDLVYEFLNKGEAVVVCKESYLWFVR